MANVYTWSSFTGGEINPLLYGRSDLQELYSKSCSKVLNMIPMHYGSITRRAGMKYALDSIATNNNIKLIPYKTPLEKGLLLEITDRKIRVIDTDNNVLATLDTPYLGSELNDIRYCQSIDEMFFVHPNYVPYRLYKQNDNWFFEQFIVTNNISYPANIKAELKINYIYTNSYIFKRENTTKKINYSPGLYNNKWKEIDADLPPLTTTNLVSDTIDILAPSELSIGKSIKFRIGVSDTTNNLLSIYKKLGNEFGFIGSIPYSNMDSSYYYIDDGTVTPDISQTVEKGTGNFIKGSYLIALSSERIYAITAVDDNGNESFVSGDIVIDCPYVLDLEQYVQLTFDAVPEAKEYKIYRKISGLYGLIGITDTNSFNDQDLKTPDYTISPPKEVDIFENGYPSVIGFHDQRLILGNKNNIYASAVGQYYNFAQYINATENSSWQYKISGSNIKWIGSSNGLVLGLSDEEWTLGGINGSPISGKVPPTVLSKSYYGSLDIDSLNVEDYIFYIDRNNRIRAFMFDEGSYRNLGQEVTIFASHLFENKIIDWAYDSSKKIIWCILSDNSFVGLTFNSEHSIMAWHRHSTQGKVLAITSIPDITNTIYLAVLRGDTVCLEKLDNEDSNYYFDSGNIYQIENQDVIEGFEHLAGQYVSILLNGGLYPDILVSDEGTITFRKKVTGILHIGLNYQSELITYPIPSMWSKKQGSTIYIDVYKSLGYEVCGNGDYYPVVDKIAPSVEKDKPPLLFTGVHKKKISESPIDYSSVGVQVTSGLPLTIRSIGKVINSVGDI